MSFSRRSSSSAVKATITKAEDISTVEVFHGDKDIHARLFDFIWPWKLGPADYTFTAIACHGPSTPVVVRVYPNVEPQGWTRLRTSPASCDSATCTMRVTAYSDRARRRRAWRGGHMSRPSRFEGRIGRTVAESEPYFDEGPHPDDA